MFVGFVGVMFLGTKLLPGKIVSGSRQSDGNHKTYKLNGLVLFMGTTIIVISGTLLLNFSLAFLHTYFWELLIVANLFAFTWTGILYLTAKQDTQPTLGKILRDLWFGVELNPTWWGVDLKMFAYQPSLIGLGKGFVVFPDDRTTPIQLDYPKGEVGLACEHYILVETLRQEAITHPRINFISKALVTRVEGQKLYLQTTQGVQTVSAEQIIGADGRNSIVKKTLGVKSDQEDPAECQRTMGLLAGSETNLFQFASSFLKGVKIALTRVIQNHVARRQWLYLLKVVISFREWLHLPLAIALPRIGLVVKKIARIEVNISS